MKSEVLGTALLRLSKRNSSWSEMLAGASNALKLVTKTDKGAVATPFYISAEYSKGIALNGQNGNRDISTMRDMKTGQPIGYKFSIGIHFIVVDAESCRIIGTDCEFSDVWDDYNPKVKYTGDEAIDGILRHTVFAMAPRDIIERRMQWLNGGNSPKFARENEDCEKYVANMYSSFRKAMKEDSVVGALRVLREADSTAPYDLAVKLFRAGHKKVGGK